MWDPGIELEVDRLGDDPGCSEDLRRGMRGAFINSNDADTHGSFRVSIAIFLGLRTADKAGRGNSQYWPGSIRDRKVFAAHTPSLCVSACVNACVCVCARVLIRVSMHVCVFYTPPEPLHDSL